MAEKRIRSGTSDDKTVRAIIEMLDRRIKRLKWDREDAAARFDHSGQIEAIWREKEAVLIRETVADAASKADDCAKVVRV